MRVLKIIFFLIALTILTTQSIRHVYIRWFEPRGSVLDKYGDKVEADIAASKTLAELEAMYAEAHRKLLELEKQKKPEEPPADRSETERYKAELSEKREKEWKLKSAVGQWERNTREIYELRFFWVCGAGLLVIGLLAHRRYKSWLSLAAIKIGFLEMIWWTSPSFRSLGAQAEFDRMLLNKLVLSIVTLAILITVWVASERSERRSAV